MMEKLLQQYRDQAASSSSSASSSSRKRPIEEVGHSISGGNAISNEERVQNEYIKRNIAGIIFEGNEGFANSVTHYYHFLFGAFYPLLEFHLNPGNKYNGYRILTDVGPMKQALLELPVNIVDMVGPLNSKTRTEESRRHLLFALPAYDSFVEDQFGDPLTPMLSLAAIVNINRFLQESIPRYILFVPKVEILLIERKSDHYYKSVEVEQKHRLSGSSLRSIRNHAQLVDALSLRYGPRFRNVVLERSSIYYQFHLFSNARVVIGQHGAALSNIVFMINSVDASSSTVGSSALHSRALIEILPPPDFVKVAQFKSVARTHFKNLSSYLNIPYHAIHQENDYSDIDVVAVILKTDEYLGENSASDEVIS